MYDSYKRGHSIHLTDKQEDQFGLSMVSPHVSSLVGFGEFAVNMSFNFTVEGSASCDGIRFVVDYGAKRSCFYSQDPNQPHIPHPIDRPSPSPDYIPAPDVHPGPPDFSKKPLPWPVPPSFSDVTELLSPFSTKLKASPWSVDPWASDPDAPKPDPPADSMKVPDCDGISLALISDAAGPGVYIGLHNDLFYAGNSDLFSHKGTTTIKMAYRRTSESEYMTYFLNGVALTPAIPFTTNDLEQGTRIFPKVTFVASSSQCPVSHSVSSVWFDLGRVITCDELEESLQRQELQWTLMLNALSKNTPGHIGFLTVAAMSTLLMLLLYAWRRHTERSGYHLL